MSLRFIATERGMSVVPARRVVHQGRFVPHAVDLRAASPHRSRNARVVPLTGMGWTVVIATCGLLAALGVVARAMI